MLLRSKGESGPAYIATLLAGRRLAVRVEAAALGDAAGVRLAGVRAATERQSSSGAGLGAHLAAGSRMGVRKDPLLSGLAARLCQGERLALIRGSRADGDARIGGGRSTHLDAESGRQSAASDKQTAEQTQGEST